MFSSFNNQMNNQSKFQEERPNRLPSTDFQTLQKARKDLIGEIQAIIEYDDHIHSTSDEVARRTWIDIRNEEMTHVGELLALLNYLDPAQKPFVLEGIHEFSEITGQSSNQTQKQTT